MKNRILYLLGAFALGALLIFFVVKKDVKEIKVPFRVEVEVPVVEKVHDTIFKPTPVYVNTTTVDTEALEKYKKANDSLREEIYKSAITEREYKEVFDDSIQTITVGANVTGTLNSLVASYKTKPRKVVLDTVLTVKVPAHKRGLTPYLEFGAPAPSIFTGKGGAIAGMPVLKGGFDLKNKKNWVYGVSYDTEKRVWLKIGKTFNF